MEALPIFSRMLKFQHFGITPSKTFTATLYVVMRKIDSAMPCLLFLWIVNNPRRPSEFYVGLLALINRKGASGSFLLGRRCSQENRKFFTLANMFSLQSIMLSESFDKSFLLSKAETLNCFTRKGPAGFLVTNSERNIF